MSFSIYFILFLLQPKIQDELIAREIIINDAESTVRYKLTKRQMQEEVNIVFVIVLIKRLLMSIFLLC